MINIKELESRYDISTRNMINDNFNKGLISENSINNIFRDNSKIEFKKIKKANKYKISVIIPTYNRIEQLIECINSILSQNFKNFEIVVIDDHSQDDTCDKIRLFSSYENISYIRNEKNCGSGICRKKGFLHASGDILIFMDDDDYLIDDNYFNTLDRLFRDDDVCMVCSNSYILYEKSNTLSFNNLNLCDEINSFDYLKHFMTRYDKPNSTFPAAFRKEDLLSQGFENMQMINDASIYLRCMLSGKKILFNRFVVGIYRVHDKNISFNIKPEFLIANLNEKLQIFKELNYKNVDFNIINWINDQIYFTVSYYIYGSLPKFNSFNVVLLWIKNNIPKPKLTLLKLYIKYYLVKLKHILKRGFFNAN